MSSHDPLLCILKVTTSSENSSKSKFNQTYTDFNEKRVIWEKSRVPEYQNLAELALKDALNYWRCPEAIPLLCSLFSQLLVKCADMTFETKSRRKMSSNLKKSLKLKKAERKLKKAFRKWDVSGKPRSVDDLTRKSYVNARSNVQKVKRVEENHNHTKTNNFLMNADINDKNKVFTKMKSIRREKTKAPTKLITPVGTYYGDDILEEFAADSENLGRLKGDCKEFDNDFYRLCVLDNAYIFDFKGEDQIQIPEMSKEAFEDIIYKNMKPGKASDIYHCTVEHLRECGEAAQDCIRELINMIIRNIYYLSCSQAKVGLGTSIHKSRKKPVDLSQSYRRVTVTPQIGGILDRYINPDARALFRLVQDPGQYGFTEEMSYLLASVERGECQHWAVDHKISCFGVSLDGEAAFPSVERQIQIRELYSTGERGDLLQYSRNTYENTECYMKLDGKLSRKFREWRGNRQGHVRADGHYKAYINPCLEAVNKADLGFQIGPFNVGATCCADDTYVLSDSPSGLQAAINIVDHYAKRYRVNFNPAKTKAVVTASKVDMAFYKDTKPWLLNGERIKVVNENEHLGLIVSGWSEEQKNVDQKINNCRNSCLPCQAPHIATNAN